MEIRFAYLKAGREAEIIFVRTEEFITKAPTVRHIRRGAFYDIRDGKAVVREGVQTTDRMDENGEYLEGTVYLRMTESHNFYDGEEISEEQADADLARYQNMLLNDDSGFVPFAEYKKK